MSQSRKETLQTLDAEEHASDEREVFLRDGKKLVISDAGVDQLVEIRNESGMLELRILLTEQGPILQMESVRLSLKAAEAVEIESRRVAITGTEQLAMTGGEVDVRADKDMLLESEGEAVLIGRPIHLNPDKAGTPPDSEHATVASRVAETRARRRD